MIYTAEELKEYLKQPENICKDSKIQSYSISKPYYTGVFTISNINGTPEPRIMFTMINNYRYNKKTDKLQLQNMFPGIKWTTLKCNKQDRFFDSKDDMEEYIKKYYLTEHKELYRKMLRAAYQDSIVRKTIADKQMKQLEREMKKEGLLNPQ